MRRRSKKEDTHPKEHKREHKKAHGKRRKVWRWVLISLVVVIIGLRIALPYIVLKYVNKKLGQMKEYYGHVEDIDIHLYRGAYVIKDIKIMKIEDKGMKHDTIPFFSSVDIDLSIQWSALFKGRIVGEIYFEKPVVNFVKGKHPEKGVSKDTADFSKLIKQLMPFTINHFQVTGGEVHYIDPYSKPYVNIFMQNIYVSAVNLSNVNKSKELLPAKIKATGSVYGGSFNLDVNMDALAKQPTFDLNAEIVNMNLVNLNPMMQAYGNFDVQKGSFGLYTEFAAKNGDFGGYVKPIIKDLDVVQWNKEEGDFKQILWETLVGTVAAVFTNQSKDQLASKVIIEGSFKDPDINVWRAITFVIRNAFLKALRPAIENTISINKLEDDDKKGFLERLFSKKKDKDKKDDKGKKDKK